MSDLTQPQIFDQVEKKEPLPPSKKPQNMDEMIVLYMEMYTNHMIMSARIEKLENQLKELNDFITGS